VKLLLDENISHRLSKKLIKSYPGSEHVNRLGLSSNSDQRIWDYARMNHFTILTYDSDFCALSDRYGAPPRVIHLKGQKRSKSKLISILSMWENNIKLFGEQPDSRLLRIIMM
jgi:predicted nuclease of predicted toxin-antitoxin system